MRKVRRLPLDSGTVRQLKRKQTDLQAKMALDKFDRAAYWKSSRNTNPLLSVLSTLKTMAGVRERCMYCMDSHGTDIEHFWPQSTYPEMMFQWSNHLLCCTDCGRIKGDRFPVEEGRPLMVDPTVDEPWNYIDFDPETGNLIARYDLNVDDISVRGAATVEILKLDKREALANGHLKTLRSLSAHVDSFIRDGNLGDVELVDTLLHDDEHGLLGWCVFGNGWKTAPFSSLRQNHPATWEALESAIRRI